MAGERFGAVDLLADTDTVLMTGAVGVSSVVNIRFVNRNALNANIRLALVNSVGATAIASLLPADFLEFDAEVPPQDVLEDSGIVVPPNFSLVVRSNTAGVNVIAYGFSEQV